MTVLKKDAYFFKQTSAAQAADSDSRSPEKDLYFENQRLSRQLKAFIAKARQNEEKYRRFQELELRLIDCASLFELLQLVLYEYRATSQLDQVSLLLHDPEYELRRILETENIALGDHPGLIFTEQLRDIEHIYDFAYQPYIGRFRQDKHEALFINPQHPPESIALIPMTRNGEVIGSLNLGSHREERFTPGSAYDFLQRLATIVAICLNNVTNAERLKLVGLTDVLTGVNNRRFFDQRLNEEVSKAHREHQSLCGLFFDVDYFKKINDTYGHHAGDFVLREVAGSIRAQLRSSDILARYGGEEFAALLCDTSLPKANEIAERIRYTIENSHYTLEDGRSINVTISIGIALFEGSNQVINLEEQAQHLLQRADECLYDAKNAGRNRVVSEDHQMTIPLPLE